jgi:hypothetical protein
VYALAVKIKQGLEELVLNRLEGAAANQPVAATKKESYEEYNNYSSNYFIVIGLVELFF